MHLRRAVLALTMLAACGKKHDTSSKSPPPPPVAVAPGPLGFADLQTLAPETLLALPRHTLTPIADVQLVAVHYVGKGQVADVNLSLPNDLPAARDFYETGYKDRAQVAGQTVYLRHYTEDTGRTTAEACVLVRDKLSVCVAVSPGKDREALPYLEALDLAALDRRAAVK
jgi:hypothetical protein